jgi:hypothetical protein
MKTKARVSVPPNGTIAGSLKVTGSDRFQVKPGGGLTVRGTERVVDPPLPVHVMLYQVLIIGETEADPEAPGGEKPTPLQEVALVDDHDSVDEAPGAMPQGLALNESVGAVGDAAARPP